MTSCSIRCPALCDAGSAVNSRNGGTATNIARDEARILADAAETNAYGVTLGAASADGSQREATSDDMKTLRHYLLSALTSSSSFRHRFGMLLMASNSFMPGHTFLFLSNTGGDATRHEREEVPNGNGAHKQLFEKIAVVYFNPKDTGEVWQGGLFRAGGQRGGMSRLLPSTPESGLVHELAHAYMWITGHSEGISGKEEEIEATQFENVYRREAGEMSRDAYDSTTSWTNLWRPRIPSY